MRWSYLSFRYHFLLFGLLIFLLYFKFYLLFCISLFLVALILFFYRKKDCLGEIEDPSLTSAFFAPLSGRVKQVIVDKAGNTQQVLIKCSWWQRGDIVMPTHGEVQSYSKDPIEVKFVTPKGNTFSLEIRSNLLVRRLPFYLWPGDRSRRLASVGFLLLGGEILIKFDEHYTIIVEPQQKVIAGRVPVAML